MACPQPVVETKKALEEETGKPILVVVDNGAAKENVSRFARNAGCEVKVEEKEGNFYLTISGFAEAHRDGVPPLDEAPRCDAAAGVVYFITTSAIGQGAPDLGSVLMKSLMSTLVEQQPPKALLLLNTGVHLAVEGSPVLEQLQKLSQAGSEILVCGTCLDYYKLKDKLAVGVVSNMYEINSRLTGPCKIITVG
jgi:selenium metabolism protein YedF